MTSKTDTTQGRGQLYERECNGGVQRVYRFPNGYGASVVRHEFSYGGKNGLWELAVIRFTGKGNDEFYLTYDTKITSDVIGCQTDAQIKALLGRIERLAKSGAK